MAPPQASTSAAAAPASDPSAPPPAAGPQKPKRKRSTKEKVPGPGKNWRKGLKGALSKKSLEHDADGHLASSAVGPDASSDALGSPSPMVVAAASSPGGPSASAPKPKAKKQKTQPHGQSPAPESVVSKELQANKVRISPSAFQTSVSVSPESSISDPDPPLSCLLLFSSGSNTVRKNTKNKALATDTEDVHKYRWPTLLITCLYRR